MSAGVHDQLTDNLTAVYSQSPRHFHSWSSALILRKNDRKEKDIRGRTWFCKIFEILERNPRKFLDFLARKPRLSKILAREPRKAGIKVIQDLLISYKQISLKNQKRGYSCVCFYLNLNLAWPNGMKQR